MRGAFGRGMKGLFSSVGRLFGRRGFVGSAKTPRTETVPCVSRIVSDAILLNEIPSPAEHESARTCAIGSIRWASESCTFLAIARVEAHPWLT